MSFEAAEPVFDVFGFVECWWGVGSHCASCFLPPRRDGLALARLLSIRIWSLQIAEVWRNFTKLVARVALWRLVSVRRLRIRILQEPHLNEVITNVPAMTEED